jgi:hypothetical protein
VSGATPEWSELLQLALDARLFELHTATPGQVVAVHTDAKAKRQYVDVRPCLRRCLEADASDALPFVEEDLPVLPRVPVGYPQGGGWFVSWPLAVGDFVTVVFAERSIDRWLATARKSRSQTISTGDVGTHTLDGAIALPCGPAPQNELLEGVSGTELVLGHVSGTPLLKFAADGTVRLTGSLVVSGEVTAGAATVPVHLTTHKHGTAMGPSGAPLPEPP